MANHPKSTANIAGHPLHPMIVPLPIALFVAAFVADLVFMKNGVAGWAEASYWLLAGGLVTAALAAVLGVADFAGDSRIRQLSDAWWHAGINVLVVVIEAANLYLRHTRGIEFASGSGWLLSGLASALLILSGWKGGELVFRHRVAVLDDTDPRR